MNRYIYTCPKCEGQIVFESEQKPHKLNLVSINGKGGTFPVIHKSCQVEINAEDFKYENNTNKHN